MMHNFLRKTLLSGVVLIIAPSLGGQTRFPGVRRTLTSPDGRYTLVNTDQDLKPYHILSLRDNRTGEVRHVLDYARSVEALWSPKGRHLALSDHYASNESTCLILTPSDGGKVIDLRKALERVAGHTSLHEALHKDDHLYIDALGWQSDAILRFKVWGYGVGMEFSREYTFSLTSGLVLPDGRHSLNRSITGKPLHA